MRRAARWMLPLLLASSTLSALACRDSVRTDGDRLVDDLGRELLFRGINARVEGLFDVSFDDGRVALEEIPPFGAADCRFLSRELGLNLLRLPVNWSGIEPERGAYDGAYLDRVVALVDACAAEGVSTLVSLHQDAWSKHIGEDGAPLWAIVPPPTRLLQGPLEDLAARRLSAQVLNAFGSFFANAQGLQDAYAAMAAELARRLSGHPGALGIDVMNEPVLVPGLQDLDPTAKIDAFHERVGNAVRAVAPDLTLFFEPNSVVRNLFDAIELAGPAPFDDVVYAPHVYTGLFSGNPATREGLRSSVANAVSEAATLGTPLLVGEWGNDPKTGDGRRYVADALSVFDEFGASWAIWLYEEWSQGSWGLYDEAPGPSRGALREPFADLLARPFPERLSGRLAGLRYDATTRVLEVDLAERGWGRHVVTAPRRTWPDGVSASCDGRPVPVLVRRSRAWLSCAGTRLVLGPG